MHGEQILVPIAFFAMITLVATGVPYVRGLVKRWEREDAGKQMSPDVTAGSSAWSRRSTQLP
jgi:hypothetical protein